LGRGRAADNKFVMISRGLSWAGKKGGGARKKEPWFFIQKKMCFSVGRQRDERVCANGSGAGKSGGKEAMGGQADSAGGSKQCVGRRKKETREKKPCQPVNDIVGADERM